MLCNFLNVGLNRIGLFVLVLLAEAENKIKEEQNLNKIIEHVSKHSFWQPKCGVVSLGEDVVARSKQHDHVEGVLPRAVLLNDELVEHVARLLGRYCDIFGTSFLLANVGLK